MVEIQNGYVDFSLLLIISYQNNSNMSVFILLNSVWKQL